MTHKIAVIGSGISGMSAAWLLNWKHEVHLPEARTKLGFDNRFCRKWKFYLATCEAAFNHAKPDTLKLVLARPGAAAAPGLPTRTSSIVEVK